MQRKMISVDQALHGYSRGHKELVSSIELDERSRTTMLMMSDLLAVSDLRPHESYLTIYPLKLASRHVIARTWPAGRNYRPGSVWTHSLILDYQALTLITDLVSLRSYFETPVEGAIRSYGRPLEVDANESLDTSVVSDERIRTALRQLYGSNPRQLIALPHVAAERDEMLTLAIWRQMWPGMRRDFSALTNPGDGHVSFDSGCTLRFTRYVSPIEDEPNLDIEKGLKELEADLPKPGPTPLRTFLGRYAIEGREPRRLGAALAALRVDHRVPMDLRLQRLRRLTGDAFLPRFVRDLLTQELALVGSSADLLSLVRSARDEAVDVDLTTAIERASVMSLDDLRDLIASTRPSAPDGLGARLYTDLIKKLPADRLARVADGDQRLRMAEIRPELLRVPPFWPSEDAVRATMLEELMPGALSLADALEVFGPTIGARTLSALMSKVTDVAPDTVVALLKLDENSIRDMVAGWIVSSPDRLRSVAERRHNLGHRAIEALAGAQLRQTAPITDPQSWASLIVEVVEDVPSPTGAVKAIGYLCSLALSGKEALELARIVFDPLIEAARSRILSRTEESYLFRNVSSYSRSWSLSKALVQSALSKWPVTSAQAGAFAITQSEAVQGEMVDEVLLRNDRFALEAILQSPQLPRRARERIEHRLRPPKSRKGRDPWSWLFGE
jgi:hypothetical protein